MMEALPFLVLAIVIIWIFISRASAGDQLTKLKSSGFSVDYLLDGTVKVAFDEKARKVAFVFRNGVKPYDYSDIKKWEWHWIEKNGHKNNNHLHFIIRDKEYPLVKVGGLQKETAEQWMARLDAILNE